MRILVCNWKDLTHPAAGGAEVYINAVTGQWAAWGHDVTLLCARAPGLAAEELAGGVRIVRRGDRFTVYREARRWYRERPGRYDVVVDVVNTRPFLTPMYVHDATVVALIFQVAREVWRYEVSWPAAVLGRHVLEPRWLRRYADVPTLTISQSSRESLTAYGLRHVAIVPVGLDTARLPAPPPREGVPTVAFLGRLVANKRPDHALEAFRLARRQVPDMRMWVIGAGPMERSLRRRFAREPVEFFGRVAHARKVELLARAHAIVVTSVREGWGLVVTEAASVGTPAIGYDVPGLRDSLYASNGVAVRPTVADLASTLAFEVPAWARGRSRSVDPGGVRPWGDVARELFGHLERESARDR